jgi:CheY-like chemotaxis protein
MNPSRYKTLPVEDNPGDARLFEEMLSEASALQVEIERAETLSETLERLAQGDHGLIVLTGVQNTALGLRAVREGAQDYLVKGEVSAAALARSVVYAIERHRQQREQVQRARARRESRVISFIGARGGVGTTIVAHNVASVLAREHSMVLIELSPGPESLSSYTCTKPSNDLRGLLDLDPSRIGSSDVSGSLCKLPQGLQVLFSPQGVPQDPPRSAPNTRRPS